MTFFFVRDHKHDHRFFSSEPPKPVEIKRSKAIEAWELAKRKLMLLPQRTLRQEQAFTALSRSRTRPSGSTIPGFPMSTRSSISFVFS